MLRVLPWTEDDLARFFFRRWLINDDFPAFVSPATTTCGRPCPHVCDWETSLTFSHRRTFTSFQLFRTAQLAGTEFVVYAMEDGCAQPLELATDVILTWPLRNAIMSLACPL